jgi:putative ABC transport system permease protein
VGARRRDILAQILVESGFLSFSGAAIGIGLGLLMAQGVEAISPLPAAVGYRWLVIAAGMGILVGVLAGLYPAARAAKLDPVVALRAE